MKKVFLAIMLLAIGVQVHADEAESYFDDQTRWTELRLDTTKYDSWFTETYVDGVLTWVPNYEKTEFYVQVDTVDKGSRTHRYGYVWLHEEGRRDSVHFAFEEPYSPQDVYASSAYLSKDGDTEHVNVWGAMRIYQFDWHKGLMFYAVSWRDAPWGQSDYFYSLGTVDEVNEGCFGTDKVLQYIDADTVEIYHRSHKLYKKDYVGTKLIKGIGVNKWKSRYCIAGLGRSVNFVPGAKTDPYMSILVHFERGGEVLYDLWPTPSGELASRIQGVQSSSPSDKQAVYDLQGRRIEGKPSRGIYIIGGQKRVVK